MTDKKKRAKWLKKAKKAMLKGTISLQQLKASQTGTCVTTVRQLQEELPKGLID
ncbi:MAG: hypothetical protein WC845_03580 [Candidatus Staskawiczbacteria bacterium]|jgi:hypothetical protein